MGYSAECFVNEIDENLFCIICLGVFEKPVHGPCGHAFCRECIVKWILPNKLICPSCKGHLLESDLVPVCRPMINLVNKQWVKCSTANCDLICELGQLAEHKHRCEDGLIMCTSAGEEGIRTPKPRRDYLARGPPLRGSMALPANGGDPALQPMPARQPRAPISRPRWRY